MAVLVAAVIQIHRRNLALELLVKATTVERVTLLPTMVAAAAAHLLLVKMLRLPALVTAAQDRLAVSADPLLAMLAVEVAVLVLLAPLQELHQKAAVLVVVQLRRVLLEL